MPTHPTRIYAHRGASMEAVENTRSAFDKALQYDIDGMETDVQLSRDEVPVLWHDDFLTRIGLPDKHTDDLDLAQLRNLDLAAHFPNAHKSDSIMLLQDFLAAYRTRCRLLIEIKNCAGESSYRHQLRVQKVLGMAGAVAGDEIIVSSFDRASLIHAHRCKPGFPLVYNFEPQQKLADAARALSTLPFLHGLCVHVSTLDTAMVKLLRDHGKSITVYTCNTEQEINTALELSVDILISDFPRRALHLRAARQPQR